MYNRPVPEKQLLSTRAGRIVFLQVCDKSHLASGLVALALLIAGVAGCAAVPQATRPPERSLDESVMNAVLVHFLTDRHANGFFDSDASFVLLHERNPAMFGILDQTELDVHKRRIHKGLLKNLIDRNRAEKVDLAGRRRSPEEIRRAYRSAPFSFEKFRLDLRVRIVDVDKVRGDGPFQKDSSGGFDGVKGYFKSFAPGYSADGNTAIVRAWVGPSPHGATVTYLLRKKGENWVVVWREFAFYA